MKFKLSTVLISVFLAGLLLYGFISLTSNDPYGDYAPGTETSITTNNGNTADTTVPGNWPYETVWNWNYRGISGVNGGTVGCCYYADHYFSNRWNSSTCYLYDNTGTNGGPGTQTSSPSYTGSIRDMTIGQDNSGSDFLYGGKGSSTLYKLGANAQTITQYSIGGAQIRAIAWDPNRKGFWVCNWHTAINCYDTTGTLIDSYAGGSALAAKYGLGWDSGYAHVDTATLFVWHQTPGQTMSEVNLSTKTVIRSFLISAGTHIAGGAEAYQSSVNNDIWLVLNYQNYANVAYKIGESGPPPAIWCDDFNDTSYTNANWTITNDGGTCVWETFFSPYPNAYTLPASSSGGVFAADADNCGSGSTTLTTATTNDINCSSVTSVWLEFDNDWRVLDTTPPDADSAIVDYSTDGGTNWTNLIAWGTSVRNTHEVHALLGAGGSSQVKVRFRSVQPGWDWWWAIDNVCLWDNPTGVTQTGNQLPIKYTLSQNYPNPFNPTTTIEFKVPVNGLVTLKVYDITGKEVATLINEVKNTGTHSIEFNATGLSSGVYFYKIVAGDFMNVKKMVLLK